MAGSLLVTSAPDGYTLMAHSDGHTINAALDASLPYDTLRDIARVSRLGSCSTALVAGPSLGVTTVKELIQHAKANPGRLSFGSAGIGGGMHLSGETFNLAAGIESMHVPYKSPIEALTDTMAGRIHYAFSPIAAALPGFEHDLWAGLFAPAGTPRPVLERISADVARS